MWFYLIVNVMMCIAFFFGIAAYKYQMCIYLRKSRPMQPHLIWKMTRNDKGGESCGHLDKWKCAEPLLPIYMDLSGLQRNLQASCLAGKKGALDGHWRKHRTEARGKSNPGHCVSPADGGWSAHSVPSGCLAGLQFTWKAWNAEKPQRARLWSDFFSLSATRKK